jgi:leucyl/phenylalanyl-tRNA--protein transferase
MSIYRLNHTLRFPPVHLAAEDGLLAVGGDLSADRLLTAYSQGIFPWPHDDLPLLWFAPEKRMALEPKEVRVSRSLRARLRRENFEVRFDTDFSGVIRGCATSARLDQDGTWIDSGMVAAYTRLHELGFAHSVETWLDGDLIGGLYGVSLGGVFFGESMFSREADASKIAFVTLAHRLAAKSFRLIDCQMHTDHLESLGATLRSRRTYMQELSEGLSRPTMRGCWTAADEILPDPDSQPTGWPGAGIRSSRAT